MAVFVHYTEIVECCVTLCQHLKGGPATTAFRMEDALRHPITTITITITITTGCSRDSIRSML
jgi:hypothetical protein